jgi:RHS repeat-associated protein
MLNSFGEFGSNQWGSAHSLEDEDPQDVQREYIYDLRGRFRGAIAARYGSQPSALGTPPLLIVERSYNEDDTVASETTRATPAAGAVLVASRTFQYDGRQKEVVRNEPNGGALVTTYDARGLSVKVTRLGSQGQIKGETTHAYNAYGELTSTLSPEARLSQYEYDGHGLMRRSIDPTGVATQYLRDGIGRVREVIVGEYYAHTKTTYDGLDRVIKVETLNNTLSVDGSVTVGVPSWLVETQGWGIESNELKWRLVDPDGIHLLTHYEYDAAGRQTGTFYGAGESVGIIDQLDDEGRILTRILRYDGEGRTGSINPSEAVIRYGYDRQGRVRGVTAPDGLMTKYFHDPDGAVVESVLPSGRRFFFMRDEAGRMLEATERAPNGEERLLERRVYGNTGNLLRIEDALGRATTFIYNNFDELVRRTLPTGWEHRYTYNLEGQLLTHRQKQGAGNFQVHPNWVYAYDAAGRLASLTATGWNADVSRSLTYDALGRVGRVVETVEGRPQTTVERRWSSIGHLMSDRLIAGGGVDRIVSVSRRGDGQVDELALPSGAFHRRGYDTLGRLETLSIAGVQVASFSDHYGLRRAREVTLQHGGRIETDYDPLGRELRRESVGAGGLPLLGEYNLYDSLSGNLVQRTRAADQVVESFGYDEFDRLSSWNYDIVGGAPERSATYDFDVVDNIEQRADSEEGAVDATINLLNQITGLTPALTSISYNSSGDEALRTGSQGVSSKWDALGRPYSATSDGDTLTYRFDGLDRLVGWGSAVLGEATSFYFGSQDMGTALASGESYEVAYGLDPTAPLVRHGFGGTLNYHVDSVGNVTGLHDEFISERYYYEPFGQAHGITGPDPVGSSALRNDLFFQAASTEPATGRVWLGARMYDPYLGRFLSRDPIGENGGLNLYAYARGNPLKWRDPTGLAPDQVTGPMIAKFFGGGGSPDDDGALSSRRNLLREFGGTVELMDAFIFRGGTCARIDIERWARSGGVDGGFMGLELDDKVRAVQMFLEGIDAADLRIDSVRESHKWASSVLRQVGDLKLAELAYRVTTDLPGLIVEKGLEQLGASADVSRVGGELAGLANPLKWAGKAGRLASRVGVGDLAPRGLIGGGAAGGVGSLDGLSRAAGALDRNGLTKAGRALQKHSSRPGSAFSTSATRAGDLNAVGQSLVDDILTVPGSMQRGNRLGGVDFLGPDGRGIRFNPDGSFRGFLEPPR